MSVFSGKQRPGAMRRHGEDRAARAVARQRALIRRGSYRRLADDGRGYVTCAPAPIEQFLPKAHVPASLLPRDGAA